MEVLGIVAPIFAIIVTGAVFSHLKILPEDTAAVLVQFAYFVLIPALLFVAIAQESADSLLNGPYLTVLGVGIGGGYLLILFGSLLLQKKGLGEATMVATCSVASNTGFVGLPILHAIFGHKAMLPAAIANIVVVTIFLVTMSILGRTKTSEAKVSKSAWANIFDNLKNPIILSTLLGILYAATPFSIPTIVADYLNILAAGMTPVALFAIGLLIRFDAFRESGATILFASLCRLIAMPALIFALAHYVIGLSPLLTIAATVSAAVPTAKTTYIIAGEYEQSADMVSGTISVTTLLSMVTLIIWLFALSRVYPSSFSG